MARRRSLSNSAAPTVRRLLVDVFPTRRQLGLQILKYSTNSIGLIIVSATALKRFQQALE